MKTPETAKLGYKYDRDRFEVHTYCEERDSWFVFRTNAKTLEEAKQQITTKHREDHDLRYFIDSGDQPLARIVHVKGTCEVVG